MRIVPFAIFFLFAKDIFCLADFRTIILDKTILRSRDNFSSFFIQPLSAQGFNYNGQNYNEIIYREFPNTEHIFINRHKISLFDLVEKAEKQGKCFASFIYEPEQLIDEIRCDEEEKEEKKYFLKIALIESTLKNRNFSIENVNELLMLFDEEDQQAIAFYIATLLLKPSMNAIYNYRSNEGLINDDNLLDWLTLKEYPLSFFGHKKDCNIVSSQILIFKEEELRIYALGHLIKQRKIFTQEDSLLFTNSFQDETKKLNAILLLKAPLLSLEKAEKKNLVRSFKEKIHRAMAREHLKMGQKNKASLKHLLHINK